jgi:hypothetical protein
LSSKASQLVAAGQEWNPSVSTGKTASEVVSFDKKAFEVTSFLRREMLKGSGEKSLLEALKLSFDVETLKATRPSWEPLFKEAGLFGTVYSTQESFDSCYEGADFLAKFNPSIKGVVSSTKCSGCLHNKISRCLIYGKPLVAKAEDLYTQALVSSVIWEQRLAGKLDTGSDKISWGETPQLALKEIYRTASEVSKTPFYRKVETSFSGNSPKHITAGLTTREIVRTASRYLNEGLYGSQLLEALSKSFEVRDIKASASELKVVLAEQGLQGIFFVDPTIYTDYGSGCREGSRLHRARVIPYVRLGEKCASCVSQTSPGVCSKYSKKLVVEPPYENKVAQQRAILASGKATETSFVDLVNSSKSVVADYHISTSVDFELNPVPTTSPEVLVELGGANLKL